MVRRRERGDGEAAEPVESPPDEVTHAGRLDGDGEALRLWNEIVPVLAADGRLRPEDGSSLTAACCWWSRWHAADVKLRADPSNVRTATVAAMAWKHYALLMGKFGLTPMDRQRIKPRPTKPAGVKARPREGR